MLVLKNNNKISVVSELLILQVVGTNYFGFRMATTGSVTLSWGDNTTTTYAASPSAYITCTHSYPSSGTYNISFSNPERVIWLNFYYGSGWYGEKINSNVLWFKQFYNLTKLELSNSTFIGELGNVINTCLQKLNYLYLYYNSLIYSTFVLNISNCKYFWTISIYINITVVRGNNGKLIGSFSDINLNPNCTTFFVFAFYSSGNISGLIKNYNEGLTSFYILSDLSCTWDIGDFDNLIIPSTLTTFSIVLSVSSKGILKNFNFKNLTNFTVSGQFDSIDLSNNSSFFSFISKNNITLVLISLANTNLTLDLSKFTASQYTTIQIGTNVGYNYSYGDLASIIAKCGSIVSFVGNNDNLIYGTFTTFSGYYLHILYLGISISASSAITLFARSTFTSFQFVSLNNFTGDISNIYFAGNYEAFYGIQISKCVNITGDITTFTYNNTFYLSSYSIIDYSYCTNLTGNLANLTLWQNKNYIKLNNCSYTGIPGFYRNIFTNRNTCLKAAGGMTYLYVQGNVDNSSLTGTYQQPNVGTYTGNINDLTETQIDNLANGLDYTGSGSNTPWTDKEKIWILTTLKNSSTDSSLRYRLSTTY